MTKKVNISNGTGWFRGDMDWSLFGKKVAKQAVYVVLAGLASMYAGNPYYLAIVPLLNGLENVLKHW